MPWCRWLNLSVQGAKRSLRTAGKRKANLGEMFNPRSALISLLAFQLLNILVATSAHSQTEPFYKGKQIRIVTGATAGGFYDRWARLLARAMPKYLPGQPDIIVQNMPGGGSLVAANYVYGVAKPDGLTIGDAQQQRLFGTTLRP